MACFCVTTVLVSVLIALVPIGYYIGVWLDKRRAAEFAKRNIPYHSLPNMLWTQVKGERFEQIQHEAITKHGPVFGSNIFMKPAIIVAEPELIQIVLSKEFTNFTDRREFSFGQDELSNSFLSIVSGEKWKRIRSVITPTFATGKLRQMQPRIDMALETLVENFNQEIKAHPEQDIDVKKLFGAFTMNTIIQVSYGLRINSLNDEHPVIVNAKKAFQGLRFSNMVRFFFMLATPKLARWLNLRVNGEVTDFFREFSTNIINKRKQDLADLRAKGETFKANNFLDFMIEAEDELQKENADMKTKYISETEMIAQCVLFFLAGYETTAMAITLSVYHLTVHQEIQKEAYDEVLSVLSELESEADDSGYTGKRGLALVNLDNLSRFKLNGAVLEETLRVYAPANFVERTAVNDIKIETTDGKYKLDILKGDLIHIPVYSTHRNSTYFPDPEVFDPYRFLGERVKEQHRYSYIPFGAGPRNCVARTFALLEAKLALINAVYNFQFTQGPKMAIPPNFYNQGGFFSPKDCFVRVKPRLNSSQ